MRHAGDSPTLFLSLEVGWKPGSKSNMVHPKHFGEQWAKELTNKKSILQSTKPETK